MSSRSFFFFFFFFFFPEHLRERWPTHKRCIRGFALEEPEKKERKLLVGYCAGKRGLK